MSVATLSSKRARPAGATWTSTPDAIPRAKGRVDIRFRRRGDRTTLADLYQSGSAKARFPRVFDGRPPEAVLINLAGGLTGGDCFQQTVDLEDESHAVVTTQAAEKIYRASEGAEPALISNALTVNSATLEWLPQETIFFDGGRLTRRLHATLTEDARLLACEATVFGRKAMGETARHGFFRDDWRVTIGNRLAFADGFCLDGAIQSCLDRPTIARGGRALATVVFVDASAEALLERAQALLADHREEGRRAAVSQLGHVLIARFIAADGVLLRTMLIPYIETIRAAAGLPGGMPKLWRC